MNLRRDKEAARLATVSLHVKEKNEETGGGGRGMSSKEIQGKERNGRSKQNEKALVKVREKWYHHQGTRSA